MKKTSSEKSATARKSKSRPGVKTGASKKIQRAEHKLAPSQTLQDLEIRYRRLFEAAQDGILILDAQTGAIDDVNPYLIDMLGYSRAEFLKKKLWEVGAFKDVDASKFKFNTLQKKGYVRYENLPLRAKGGRLVQVEFVSNVYLVGTQKVIQCNIRDITARVQAEQAVQLLDRRFRSLIEKATDGLTLLDAGGNVTYDSPAAPGMLGYGPQEWIGRKIFEIIHPDDLQKSRDLFRQLLKTPGARADGTFRVKHKSGVWVWIECVATNLLEEPAVNAIVLNYRDITARKETEEALALNEERFRSIIELSFDAVSLLDQDGNVLYSSPGVQQLLGYAPEERLGRSGIELLHPDDAPKALEAIRHVAEQARASVKIVERFLHKDGTWRWLETTLTNLLAAPAVHAIVTRSQDVTERTQIEEALHASEKLYRSLFENMLDGYGYHKMIYEQGQPQDFIFLDVNGAFESLTGLKNVVGKKATDVIPGLRESDPELFEVYGRVALTGNHERFETYVKALKQWFFISVYSPEKEYFVTIFEAITERKQAEHALQESEERFRKMFEEGPIGVALSDKQYHFVRANSAFCRLLGYTEQELKKLTFKDITHPEDILDSVEKVRKLEKGDFSVIKTEKRYITKKKEIVWGALTLSTMLGQEGKSQFFLVMIEDITKRKQAEEAVRASEARFRGLFEDSPISLWEEDFSAVKQRLDALRAEGITDFQAYFASHPEVVAECVALIKILDVNKATLKLFGANRKEDMLKNLGEISKGVPPPEFVDEFINIAAGKTRFDWEGLNKTFDGRLISVEANWSAAPGFEDSLSRVNLSMVDITERKQAEEALRASETRYRGLFEDSPISLWEEDFSAVKRRLDALRAEGITDFPAYFASHPEVVTECAALIKVLDVNKATLKLFVALRKEDLQKNLAEIFEGEPHPTFIDELSMIAAGQAHFHHEIIDRRLDGKLINVEIDSSVAPGHEKSLSKVNISMIDITERKQAEEALMHERNLIRTLIDIVPDIIFAKDMEGRFLLKNAADARRMGASSPEETIGKTDFDYYPHDLAAHYSADDEIVLRSGQPIVDRQELTVDAAGHSGWLSTTKVPLRDAHGEVIGLVGIGHDITERKQAEKLQDAVFRIASAAVTPGSLDDLYAEIHRIISDVMPAENFYITLYDEDRDLLTFPYFQDTFDKNFQDEVHPQKGLTAYVLRTGKSLLCTQAVHDDLERRGEVKLLGTASSIWLGVPLSLQGKVIGAMVVQHYTDPEAYGEREQHMLEYVSGQVATAISRKRAEEGIQRQLARLAALHDIDQFVSSSFDLHMTLNEILKHVKKELGVDAADVLLLNSTSLFLEYGAGLGFRTKQVEKASVRLGQSLAGAIALKRELVHITNLNDQAPDMWLKTQLAGEGFVGYCGVPLIVKGGVRGVLEVYHRSPLKPDQEWFDFLNTLAGQAAIAIDNALLFENLQRSNVDLTLAYDATIEGWSRAMDLRDKETEGHTLRVTEITMELAGLFGIKDEDLTGIRRGALLHDIGKMGVPDAILFKPGPLTDEEWTLMKKHPVQAFDMLSPIRYLQSAVEIPYCHHEKWDGTGYPRGLKGKQIPLAARIFAIVDVWDALTSDRPYRAAWSHEKAIEYIKSQSGIHFDPEIVNVCLGSGVFDLKKPKINNG